MVENLLDIPFPSKFVLFIWLDSERYHLVVRRVVSFALIEGTIYQVDILCRKKICFVSRVLYHHCAILSLLL